MTFNGSERVRGQLLEDGGLEGLRVTHEKYGANVREIYGYWRADGVMEEGEIFKREVDARRRATRGDKSCREKVSGRHG